MTQFATQSIFVTGHTGFKGAWLSLWLAHHRHVVHGYSLESPTQPNLFDEARVADLLTTDVRGDVRDLTALTAGMQAANPAIVVHMAAQPIVRQSVAKPRETWEINVLGTVNLLEAVRQCPSVRTVLVVTSDKCYANSGDGRPLRESDPLGGADPYSASKAAAELAVASYRRTYFPPGRGVSVATARAGNVIGGGDWAADRLIPDCVRALERGQPIPIRNPNSVRPWQHVLDVTAGYYRLLCAQSVDANENAEAFNFGPRVGDTLTAAEVVDRAINTWGSGRWEQVGNTIAAIEAPLLTLDTGKVVSRLNWSPKHTSADAVVNAVHWYRMRHETGNRFNAQAVCLAQVAAYCEGPA